MTETYMETYMVCWVAFHGTEKTYCYLSNDYDFDKGDLVIVPVGEERKQRIGVITYIEHFDIERPEELPYPLGKNEVDFVQGS